MEELRVSGKRVKKFIINPDAVYGAGATEAWANGLYIDCREEALPKCYSDAGKKEFSISGLCEVCFDKLFAR